MQTHGPDLPSQWVVVLSVFGFLRELKFVNVYHRLALKPLEMYTADDFSVCFYSLIQMNAPYSSNYRTASSLSNSSWIHFNRWI